jgi:DNA-binding MarR family transcriptional regulator
MVKKRKLTDRDYQLLLEFRAGLRQFLHWSKSQAEKAGLTSTQHQLLLAVRGHEDGRGPTIREVADSMMLRHHSAVELVDRAEAAGLVRRISDSHDQRLVRVRLSSDGARKLERLTLAHLDELEILAPRLTPVWDLLNDLRR